MGTNFYLHTKDKQLIQKLSPYGYDLTDMPDWGYKIHVAKTSMGWLPLFQGHKCGVKSVKEYLDAIQSGAIIYDEYGVEYGYDDFLDRVVNFNGGVVGGEPAYDIMGDRFDSNIPAKGPISHIPGTAQSYLFQGPYSSMTRSYFTDDEGYEFDWEEFS